MITLGNIDEILQTSGGTTTLLTGFAAVAFAFLFFVPTSSFTTMKKPKSIHPPSESAVLITGGSRGIGKSTAYHLMDKGYFVFVTVRSQKQYDELENDANAPCPCPILLDVTNNDQIEPAVKRVQEVCTAKGKSLVAIVNNAAINPEGDAYQASLEAAAEQQQQQQGDTAESDTPDDDGLCDPAIASRVFETNVVGVMRATRAFLPLLLANNNTGNDKGRVIMIGSYFGSMAGKIGLRQAAYEASKFAMEGLADNMRRSLKPRGIKVSLIKPGNISTDMNSYGETGPQVVAKDIEHAIAAPKPRSRYYPGTVKGYSVRFLCWLFECLPTYVSDSL